MCSGIASLLNLCCKVALSKPSGCFFHVTVLQKQKKHARLGFEYASLNKADAQFIYTNVYKFKILECFVFLYTCVYRGATRNAITRQ